MSRLKASAVIFTFLHTTSYCKLARYVSRLRMSSHTCMPLYVLWVLRRAARMLRNTERAVKTEYLSPRLSLRISVEVPPRYQRCNRSAAKHFMFLWYIPITPYGEKWYRDPSTAENAYFLWNTEGEAHFWFIIMFCLFPFMQYEYLLAVPGHLRQTISLSEYSAAYYFFIHLKKRFCGILNLY